MKKQILVFESVHQVLKAEKLFQNNQIKHEIIPTPRKLSSQCGVCIRIKLDGKLKKKILSILNNAKIPFQLFNEENPS